MLWVGGFFVVLTGYNVFQGEELRGLVMTAAAVSAMTTLSMLQMVQYWNGLLPGSDLTWSAYKAIFLKL